MQPFQPMNYRYHAMVRAFLFLYRISKKDILLWYGHGISYLCCKPFPSFAYQVWIGFVIIRIPVIILLETLMNTIVSQRMSSMLVPSSNRFFEFSKIHRKINKFFIFEIFEKILKMTLNRFQRQKQPFHHKQPIFRGEPKLRVPHWLDV